MFHCWKETLEGEICWGELRPSHFSIPLPTHCGVEASHRPTVVTYLLGQQCWWSWWAPGSDRGGFSQLSQVLKFFSVRVRDQRPRVLLEATLDLQTASWMCPEITSWVKTRLPSPKPHPSPWTIGSKFLPLLWHWCMWPQARHKGWSHAMNHGALCLISSRADLGPSSPEVIRPCFRTASLCEPLCFGNHLPCNLLRVQLVMNLRWGWMARPGWQWDSLRPR